MARNSFSTGANMRGFVDIYANNVSLVETNKINNMLIIQGLKLPMKKIIIMKLILVILMFLDYLV